MSDTSCGLVPDLGSDMLESLSEGFMSCETRIIEHRDGIETFVCTGVWTSPDEVEYYFRISDVRNCSNVGGVSSIRLIPVEECFWLDEADGSECDIDRNPFTEENYGCCRELLSIMGSETGITPETRFYSVSYSGSDNRSFVIHLGDNFTDRLDGYVCLEDFLRSLGYRIVWGDPDPYIDHITVHDVVRCEPDDC